MGRINGVREANIFHGTDVKLGWIYNSSKMEYDPPKMDICYNSKEYRKWQLDICTKNDKIKLKRFDSNKDKPWHKDFCNISANEIIYVYGSAEIERRASEAISYEQEQEIVTTLLNNIEIVILIFLNKELLYPFKTSLELKDFLTHTLEGKMEAFLPDCLRDGVKDTILYTGNQRVTSSNVIHTLKEGCRILKTSTFEKAKSVYSMEGKLHDTMLKEQISLNNSLNRKSNVAEAISNSVNKKDEVASVKQPIEQNKYAIPSAVEYSKINKHETTKMKEAIANGTNIDNADNVEKQNNGINNISQNTKESENHTKMFSDINRTNKEVLISTIRDTMQLNNSKGSCNNIPMQGNLFTEQGMCAPVDQNKTKDKKQEPGTVNMIPTINSDKISSGMKSIDNKNTDTINKISINSEKDIPKIHKSIIPRNIKNSDKLLANNETKDISNANNKIGQPTDIDTATNEIKINQNIHPEQMKPKINEGDNFKSEQKKENIKEKDKSILSQIMIEPEKQLTKYSENNTSSKERIISSGKEPQELNTSIKPSSYIRCQDSLTPKQLRSVTIEQPGTKEKNKEPAGQVVDDMQTKILDHMSLGRTDINCQNEGTDTIPSKTSEKSRSEAHDLKALGIVNESGKVVRDDNTINICVSKNTDYTTEHQKCINKANYTIFDDTNTEIISKTCEPKNRTIVNEAYHFSSDESNVVHDMNNKSLNTNDFRKSCSKVDVNVCQASPGSSQNLHNNSGPTFTNNSQDEHYNQSNKTDNGTKLLSGNSSSTVLKSTATGEKSCKVDKLQYNPSSKTSTSNVSTKSSNSFKILESKSKIVDSCGIEKHCYGSFPPDFEEKVILLLGASGSGKTTLINFVANYFEEVKTPDEKMVLINPNLSSSKQSRTQKITSHSFSSAKEPGLVFTFVDTPGLNDSSGVEVRDHVQSLKTFLANMNANNMQIHALGFVAQAHLVRLTSSERLVMDYVSTLFGEKVKDNIITFVTFADNQENPPVVEAIENYGLKTKYFLKFNNSILSANTYEVEDLDRVYWRKGYKSLKKGIKIVKEMAPLCVNAMKALQREVHSKTVVDGVMKDLEAEVLGLHKEKRREHINKISNSVWDLATVAFYQIKRYNNSYSSVEELARKITIEVCQNKSLDYHNCLKYLTLAPNRGMRPAAFAVIYSLKMVYNVLKTKYTEKRNQTRTGPKSPAVMNGTMLCHQCDQEHLMERINKPGLMGYISSSKEVKLKCTICSCAGDLHEVKIEPNARSNLSSNIILEHARSGLSKIISRYSIPDVSITKKELLEFLMEEVDDQHKSFIKDLLILMENTV